MARLVPGRLAVTTLCSRHLPAPGAEPAPPQEGTQTCAGVCPHSSPNRPGGGWGPLPSNLWFGFTEEEKDDGLTMSVVSGEGTKSPPNGDRVEAQSDRPAKPGESETCLRSDTPCLGGTQCWCAAAGGGGDRREGLGHGSTGKVLHLLQEGQQGIFQYLTRAMRGRGSHPTEGGAGCLFHYLLCHIPQKQQSPPQYSAVFLQFSHLSHQ